MLSRPIDDAAPWARALPDDGLAVLVLWTTGPDVRTDGIVRVLAAKRVSDGMWEGFERTTSPFRRTSPSQLGSAAAGEDASTGDLSASGATARIRRAYGLTTDDLRGAPDAAEVWSDLRAFIGALPVLGTEAAAVETWARALDERAALDRAPLTVLGLDELTALFEPGRLATKRDGLVRALLPPDAAPHPHAAVQPPHLLAALAELVARFQDRGAAVLPIAASGYRHALTGLRASDPPAAARLALALDVADSPGRWCGAADLFAHARLSDGMLTRALAAELDEEDPLRPLEPAASHVGSDLLASKALPPDVDGDAAFPPEDLALLDDLFRVHLPALFATSEGVSVRPDHYRDSQHRVAEEVARCLADGELLLVHAPTGTGKTLAYLLPALLWARRHGVRVGVATYTRALQEQAMDREVPRALQALARAGVEPGFRVSTLKGREHSLCWRALRLATPADDDEPESWLAWTTLALFGLADGDGDLDRLPRRPPITLTAPAPYRGRFASLLRQARARPGCCIAAEDRATCAAEVARRRAERSHVVLTNQSFALIRPEFFKRVVFDECEHLHDQAASAWSKRLTFEDAREVLRRLHLPDDARGSRTKRRRSRAPLDRLARSLPQGDAARSRLGFALENWSQAAVSLSRLEEEVLAFERWRSAASAGRNEAEQYALFREYIETSDEAGALVLARELTVQHLGRLDGLLAQLGEDLEQSHVRRAASLRRALEVARLDLLEIGDALAAWLPLDDGVPRFSETVFHDVERGVRGQLILAARVLLPGESLGRHYYPELAAAAFVSATTRLEGGFERARSYLGLDRVEGRTARTFHAPEVFDYSRVLVGAPRGLPSVRDRTGHRAFLARFLVWLAERTRGRVLVLFTSLEDVRIVAELALPAFVERNLPLLWQGMPAAGKEELADLFRDRDEATLFGVDTFWYGADFPGETLEVLILARLPYGVPDRFHHAQCAAIGRKAQRDRIYMPRALAKFRQGFGRLMRRATDRGVVLILDGRVTERSHQSFLRELPIERPGAFARDGEEGRLARFVRGDLDRVCREVLAHLGLLSDLAKRGLSASFLGDERVHETKSIEVAGRDVPLRPETPPLLEIDEGELPF